MNELVWLWRAGVARDREEAVKHLEQALRINPASQVAKSWKCRFAPEPTLNATEFGIETVSRRDPARAQALKPVLSDYKP